MSGTLFISHASEDGAEAERIVAYLESRGVSCWISSRDIPPRAVYADAITEGVEASAACAVLVSKAANESKAIKRELELASHYDKPFIPIRLDGSEPAKGFDYYLRNVQWMDYRRDGERALDRIIAHIEGAPAPAPAPTRKRSPVFLIGAAVIALVLMGGGWFAYQAVQRDRAQATAQFELTREHESAARERDAALAGAKVAQDELARERESAAGERDVALAGAKSAQDQLARERALVERGLRPPQPQQAQAPEDAAGAWVHSEALTFTLSPGGRWTSTHGASGTWTQDGDRLRITYDMDGSYHEGRVRNGVFTGQNFNRAGADSNASIRLVRVQR